MKTKNIINRCIASGFGIAMMFGASAANPGFVYTQDGKLMLDGKPYTFVGTNFWYGPLLGAKGGNRERLSAELDLLQKLGIDNLRVLAGADGSKSIPSHVEPTLQKAPGVYNDSVMDGLDYFLAEIENRGMKAVVYLNNAWEWSGGYTTYLEWAGEEEAPLPLRDGYPAYMEYASKFPRNEKAKALAAQHIKNIVSRTNRYTGRKYKDSPAIMSWQIANEPRAFSEDSKKDFAEWIHSTARLIKEIDPNHLVSTGSEGKHGCEQDIDLWTKIHSYPEIDYANIHIWPYNWGWAKAGEVEKYLETAKRNSKDYIGQHVKAISKENKPIVIEEFGYPRDGMKIEKGSPTTGRDGYFEMMFNVPRKYGNVSGVNFWSWGGYGNPTHRSWQPGDDYTGDPAQEDQGLNSVYASDTSTLDVIRKATSKMAVSKSTPADILKNRLENVIKSNKTMFGHHDDTAYGHTWSYQPGRSDMLESVGKYPAVLSWDLGGIENGDSLNLDGVPFSFMKEEILRQNDRGGINTFSWHTRNPINNNDSWTVDDKTIVRRMMENPEGYRKQLKHLADFFNSLRDEKGNKIPVIFRPWHEHTGGWFFWGTPNTTKEEYAFLWKEMRKVLDSEGVNNVVWAYSPDRVADEAKYLERYPGDEYVDIMGLDVYHFDGEKGTQNYIETVERDLDIVNNLAKKHGKIPAFTETGLESITIPDWYTEILLPLLKKYNPAYVVVWRNAHDKPNHYYIPYKGHPAEKSFREFISDPSIMTIPGGK